MLEKYRIGDLHTYLQQRGIAYRDFLSGRDLRMTDLLNVADPEKSAAVYEKIFGAVPERKSNRIWFQTGRSRIGLLPSPEGQGAGVNHFCVAAAPFKDEAAAKRLWPPALRSNVPMIRLPRSSAIRTASWSR